MRTSHSFFPIPEDLKIDNPIGTSNLWLDLGERSHILISAPGVIKKLLELLEPYKDYP